MLDLAILSIALVFQGITGFLTPGFGRVLLFALPATIVGVGLGRRLYGRLDIHRFRRVVLCLLLVGGCALIAGAVRALS